MHEGPSPPRSDAEADAAATAIEALAAPHVGQTGGLMTALRAVQATCGHIPATAWGPLAHLFNLTQAEVRGVASFYEDFSETPRGRHWVRVCQAEACQAVGARALGERLAAALGVGLGETRADGLVSLAPVYCLGLCSAGPAVMIDGCLHGRVEGARAEALVCDLARKVGP
ncbi:MAG: NADH-quinone oxidoreductase subunit E [Alphaproteobacteria bacterium]|nr:MAG: NADH-quinone oxidoreductase subunit E [Alphaproteobacteria bacterium]